MRRFLKWAFTSLAVFIALVIAAAYYFGILDWQETETTLRVKASQASAELRSGVSELGSTPGTSGSAVAQARECRANLRRIESAKRAAADKRGVSVGSIGWDAVESELGGDRPECPAGGRYTLGTLEVTVRCSVGSNRSTDKADDHHLKNY